MLDSTKTFLSSLVYASTRLHLAFVVEKTITKDNQTAFIGNCFFDDGYIRLNPNEIESVYLRNHLIKDRGFTKEYLAMEVILHEIAHVKQYKKFIRKRKWFKCLRYHMDCKKRHDYHELVADRYAHYCLKILLRALNHKDLFKIVLNHKLTRKEDTI